MSTILVYVFYTYNVYIKHEDDHAIFTENFDDVKIHSASKLF